jgi:hypothetical protein
MQLILGLFLIVAAAGAIAQQYSTASSAPLAPDAVQHPSSETPPETATVTSTGARTLPDAPSYTTLQPSSNASTMQPERTLGSMTGSFGVGSRTTLLSPISKRYLNLAMPNGIGGSSLIFVGGTSAGIEAAGPYPQSDGSVSGSAANCRRGAADKADGNGWITSLLSVSAKGGHYCPLGEGGFWKRGTYAASRAFAAHKYDGANSFSASGLLGPVIAPGFPAGYPYPSYAGERLAQRYASALGRDALRNMFREFWPDISTHMLHRHP